MAWSSYWRVLRRRWWIVAAILLIDLVASLYLYRKADVSAGFQSCMTLYVADMSAPSLIAAPSDTLDTAGQALAGETAANFFADDILDVSQSRSVASYVARRVPGSTAGSFSVGGSRKDRTVNLCISDASAAAASSAGSALARAMTTDRKLFVGPMAKRIYTRVISAPLMGPAPTSHALLSLLLRLALGVIVALGAAFLVDALDPSVRNEEDVERALGVPAIPSSV